jgi:hypothetical protein
MTEINIALAVGVFGLAAAKLQPLTAIQRAAIHMRAAGMLAAEMGRAAWSVRNRWTECVDRAKREI